MEMAKKGFVGNTTEDIRDVILQEQGLFAYDIWAIHYSWAPTNAPFDTIDNMIMALSRRLEDMVVGGAIAIDLAAIMTNQAIFGIASFYASFDTSGMAVIDLGRTIVFPKPYRVPFAAFLSFGSSSIAVAGSCEVYYDEVKVSSREMAWLRRRTEVIRTS